MNYTGISIKVLLELISKINKYLYEERQMIISDLAQLENFFKNPIKRKVCGSLTMKFSTQKILQNGTIVQLTETLEFLASEYTVKSIWTEGCSGINYTKTDCRVADGEPEKFIPYQIEYSWNAIFNILSINKGTFEIVTDQFSINK